MAACKIVHGLFRPLWIGGDSAARGLNHVDLYLYFGFRAYIKTKLPEIWKKLVGKEFYGKRQPQQPSFCELKNIVLQRCKK